LSEWSITLFLSRGYYASLRLIKPKCDFLIGIAIWLLANRNNLLIIFYAFHCGSLSFNIVYSLGVKFPHFSHETKVFLLYMFVYLKLYYWLLYATYIDEIYNFLLNKFFNQILCRDITLHIQGSNFELLSPNLSTLKGRIYGF
jgi:hypothetical protein